MINWDDWYDDCDEDVEAFVLDLGSGSVKAGQALYDYPRVEFPSLIGKVRPVGGVYHGMDYKWEYLGMDVITKRVLLKSVKNVFPVDRNQSYEKRDLSDLLDHTFKELRINREDLKILSFLITSLSDMKESVFKDFCSLFFEDYKCPQISFVDSSLCSMIGSGRTNGLVLECGNGVTLAQPIIDSQVIHHAKIVFEDQLRPSQKRISGDLITDTFIQLCRETEIHKFDFEDPSYHPGHERNMAKYMKQKHCQLLSEVSGENGITSFSNIKKEKQEQKVEELILFDLLSPTTDREDLKLKIGMERIYAPEILFNPKLIGYDLPGIHHLVKKSISLIDDPKVRDQLYANIVPSGCTTLLKNFVPRLTAELKGIIDPSTTFNIIEDPPYRDILAWCGAGKLAIHNGFKNQWMKKEEYEEEGGYRVMMKKCTNCSKINNQIGVFKSIMSYDVDLKERTEFVVSQMYNDMFDTEVLQISINGVVFGKFIKLFL